MKNPCVKECPDRKPGCRDNCVLYDRFQEFKKEKYAKKITLYNLYDDRTINKRNAWLRSQC